LSEAARGLFLSGHGLLKWRFFDKLGSQCGQLKSCAPGSNYKKESNMSSLAEKECVPCKGGVPPLKGPDLAKFKHELNGGWQLVQEHHLEKEYPFKDFRQALNFTNKVGELAESQGHHPDIYLAWGKVKLTIWTHKIEGLTESDFVFAAKADKLLAS